MPAALRSRLTVGSLTASRLRDITRRRFAEAAGVALAVVALATLAALASYNPGDPSFDTATPMAPTNLLGAPGAIAADLLIQGFGMACLLPPLAMLGWAWRVASHRGLQAPALRLIALLCAVPACAGTFAGVMLLLGGHGWSWPGPAGLGGAVGGKLSQMTFGAGRALIGPYGGAALWSLGGLLALVLAPLSLGLSAGEWRAAGRGAQNGFKGGAARLRRGDGGHRFWLRRRPDPDMMADHASEPVSSGRSPIAAQTAAQASSLAMPAPARREPRLRSSSGGYMLPPGQDQDDIPAPPLRPASRRKPPAPDTAHREGGLSAIRKLLGVSGPAAPTPRAETAARPRAAPDPDTAAWTLPPLSLLQAAPPRAGGGPSPESLQANARLLETVLSDYGVQGAIGAIHAGPVVTLYELEPAPGIRSARVIGLADDIARSLSVTAVRIATVPGRNVIGIEVPNARRETVYFSELLDADAWQDNTSRLCLALGKDIAGSPVYADLARMPHLLIAGTTGSGKSVGVNAMILSLLYRLSPEECRLILIDPKMLELSIYDGIPHLMAPVVTEPAKAVTALKWTVREMERRYRGMSQLGVRNMLGYNERVAAALANREVLMRRVQTGFDPETGKPTFEEQPLKLERLPYIVVVIDEMADLMMVAGKEIEAAVQRLAQMARAAGIHVIAATQRPSVDVITGTIKANFPTRISFQVISKFDSRTILGEQGSEQLLGQGDMLYMQGGGRITRVHGPFVGDTEVEDVVRHLRQQGEPDYMEDVTSVFEEEPGATSSSSGGNGLDGGGFDSETGLFDQAVSLVAREGKASTSFIQRHLSIGYNRAAKLIEQMEKQGIVGPANHVGKREVLVRREAAEQD
ncbi:DNA translocase FtsK 4TM domain-containing protein [Lichenicoccus sp.]|uniref:DNA translocase FtsK n=1 Tax=Lichenicoccus sp. TaxID=2781899 RepID=UPI003D151C6B